MNKAVFIIPYFGKFNNYFQLFLNSCEKNLNYDWLIFTDDKTQYKYPNNVSVHYMTFCELKEKIVNKFPEVNICLRKTYKLCDYKPLYGYIFEEFINKYEFWGFCDIDLIFGNINSFLNLESLKAFDRIEFQGHFSLFKNNKEIREIFKKNDLYKEILEVNKNCKFDEEFSNSINNILKINNKKIYINECYADIYTKSSNFRLVYYNFLNNNYIIHKKNRNFFVWDKGSLYQIYYENNKFNKKEYMYIHLQKRKMRVNNKNLNTYKIIPNSFEDLEKAYYSNNFKKIKIKHFNLHYFNIRFNNLKSKMKMILEKGNV